MDTLDEWSRRAAGKYGNELQGEALAYIADLLGRRSPIIDPFEWIKGVRLPGWEFEVHDVPELYAVQLEAHAPDFLTLRMYVSLHHLQPGRGRKVLADSVRHLVMGWFEGAFADAQGHPFAG